MKRIALAAALSLVAASNRGFAEDLTRVAIPDEAAAAVKTLSQWLAARGFEVDDRGAGMVLNRGGVVMNITPFVHKQDLDRLMVTAYYHPQDELKGKPEIKQFAASRDAAQNLFRVLVDEDGDVAIQGYLTFYDEVSARHFDAYIDNYAQAVNTFVLTEEAAKLLK